MIRSPHPRLKRLVANGLSARDTHDCLAALVKVLESARELEELDILIATGPGGCARFDASNDVVQALPSGIKSLTLTGDSTFPPSSLICALRSGALSSLSTLKITRFSPDNNGVSRSESLVVQMEQIEELCRAGEIELEWADIWGRGRNRDKNHEF